jgi:hypothetical protein
LASETFGVIVKAENETGDYVIYTGEKKPLTFLINDDLAHDAKMLWIGGAKR